MTGVVDMFYLDKGYGFIDGEDGNTYFFHKTFFKPDVDLEKVERGTRVQFNPTVNRNHSDKLIALKVILVDN